MKLHINTTQDYQLIVNGKGPFPLVEIKEETITDKSGNKYYKTFCFCHTIEQAQRIIELIAFTPIP